MAKRFKKTGPLLPHFIKEWREHRGLTQDQLAERLPISKASLSRIENLKTPYTQDFLEACAEMLMCEPADLIMRNPLAPEAVWSIWDNVPPEQRSQALEVLKTFRRTGT
jgi:transcriptional regulator with XRE-family HTH domain